MKKGSLIHLNKKLICLSVLFIFTSINLAQNKLSKDRERDAFAELETDSFVLRFFDALTGAPIKGASVKIGNEQLETDFDGRAYFPQPENDKNIKVAFLHPKYIPTEFEIEITAGSIFFNRFSISPILPLGSFRIVFDWGAAPRDLDANLVKKDDYHISFRNMIVSGDGNAKLDRDDTDGFGPETITVNKIEPFSTYTFFVHNFSDKHDLESSGLSDSKATVKIYGDNKLLNIFNVPVGKFGNYWEVFRIIDGQIKVIDEVKEGIEE